MEEDYEKLKTLVNNYIYRLRGPILNFMTNYSIKDVENKLVELERISFREHYGESSVIVKETVDQVNDVLCSQNHAGLRHVLHRMEDSEEEIRQHLVKMKRK